MSDLRKRIALGPVVVDDVAMHLCPGLAAEILYLSTRGHSEPSLNKRAWKSRTGVLEDGPSLRALRDAIIPHLEGRSPSAWAMVNRLGSVHPRHVHADAPVSGVYYVTAGDPAVATHFEVNGGVAKVEPCPGRLVLFAGDTWHWVPTYEGEAPRITIAFDAKTVRSQKI